MASPQDFVTVLEHLRTTVYFNVASATILVFDYFLTLPSEVELIWPSHWTVTKVLFLVSRYLPFFTVSLLFYIQILITDAKNCLRICRSSTWLSILGMGFTEVILTMRTWAVWNRDRRLGICLVMFFGLCWIPIISLIVVVNNSWDFMLITSPQLLGCLPIKGSRVIIMGWIALLVYEFGIFFLMTLKAVQCYKLGGMTGLSRVVFRDGLVYYLYLFAFSIINVALWSSLPPSLRAGMVSIQQVIHPILACRVILDLRSYLSTHHIVMHQPAAVALLPLPSESTRRSDAVSPAGESASTLDIRSSLPRDAD